MDILDTRTVADFRFDLAKCPGIETGKNWVVAIYANGVFYDHREFYTESEARAFLADPLASERPKAEKPAEIDRSYIALGTTVSRGRKVGRKPAAA